MNKILSHTKTEQIMVRVTTTNEYLDVRNKFEKEGFKMVCDSFHYALPDDRTLTFEKSEYIKY